jgi:hypothetical protein
MKNRFKILILVFTFFLVSKVRGQISQMDSTTQIVESFKPFPFDIKRKSMYVNLPDKLKGIGLGVIKLYLNDKGELLNMDIQKLKIRFRNGKNIDFYSTDSLPKYPKEVKKYYPPLRKYVDGIRITPVSQISLSAEKISSIYLMVKFKQKPSQ